MRVRAEVRFARAGERPVPRLRASPPVARGRARAVRLRDPMYTGRSAKMLRHVHAHVTLDTIACGFDMQVYLHVVVLKSEM